MEMARESALTKPQKESIKINKFIFHITSNDEDKPIYLDEILLTDKQKKFLQYLLYWELVYGLLY
jgi:hypothetical protein